MQIAITSRHGSISPEAQELIREKSEKLLTYFARVTSINVTVSFEHHRATVEILVDAEHKHDFVATDTGDEVIPVFYAALHKMEQQIHKYKEKVQDHKGGPTAADVATLPAEGEK
ncbi:ribosomal subunit interface protein [Planctopirus limnophila DSM 3776]|uniref:Ribosomal subunit interface protein n=1 Tax=Planctopirus limnophila (strain ATCC 43296 / DSM 3776 / IFAM 1008 / Mu 290) TaxID=521674 RepID=D5SPI3_PLAL2|nr:ribosome-associated translation inhibitor RaiA [Planctopirus limnophila]ADG66213.1 ribosomal subunit interface protein [Planctopirus limnophila DSM 3776]